MKLPAPILTLSQPALTRLKSWLNRLRKRFPKLPGNRAILSAAAVAAAALALLVVLQIALGPRQKFTTYTLPYEQNFDEVNLRNWFVGDGVWGIRTGTLAQTVGGEDAAQVHVPFKLPEDIAYHASVYITLKKDSRAAGLSFNAQYPTLTQKQHRVYLSRPEKNTLELVAGYMDTSGSFVNQAQVRLPINTTEFRLDVYVYENSYLVQVNGQRLIENRPLVYHNGLIGFYTLGPAAFDTFKLTAADNPNPGDMVYTSDFDQEPGGAGWVPFGGSWKIANRQMVQSDPAAALAGIGYETSTFQNYTLRVNFNHMQGQGAGVLFNMPSPYQVNGAQVVRYSDETDALIWGAFDEAGAFVRQGFASLPAAGVEPHTLQIFSGESSYDIFLDNQLIARDIAMSNNQGCIGLLTSAASAGYSLVEVYPLFGAAQPLTPVIPSITPTPTSTRPAPTRTKIPTRTAAAASKTATAATLIPGPTASQPAFIGSFTGKVSDQGWVVLSGSWRFQDGKFVQTRTDGYDFSAAYTGSTFSEYSYQIGLVHTAGSGAGLLFNLPSSKELAGATMVRYSDRRDNALMWGYFDQDNVYRSQGYADVPSAGNDRHTLRVESGATSYTVYLDDRLIVRGVPFGSGKNSGYIGLLTSVASVAYDEVRIQRLGTSFKSNYTLLDGFSDQRTISGTWTLTSNKISQSVPDLADYAWNTGVSAAKYTLSAKIILPATPIEAGGGFILHMPERGTKDNATLVRLTQGGQGIWWGTTDDQGKFKGQGSAKLQIEGNTCAIKVIVNKNQMSIFVNDRLITDAVQMPGVEGWIGLVAYGGPVSFEDVILEVEE